MTSAVASRPALAVALSAVTASVLLGAASPAEAATSKQTAALNAAKTRIGKPYVYGATGPDRFDCSGLTQWSYKQAGKDIPRTAQQQYNSTRHVSAGARRPGDLVFIGTPGRITHAGIYAGFWSGRSWMVNANTGAYRGRKVVVAPISEYTAGSPKAYYGQVR
ncbi:C40 family peptidase [Streptomyces sp. NPDC021080]|uniref:C40 family peptidase n=1 Tax=Streptomyces sp. NPDC021080 TaxID=3365110 RepID=UPI0037A8C35C